MDKIAQINADNLFKDFGHTVKSAPENSGVDFGKELMDAIKDVNQLQHQANMGIEELAAANEKDIHKTMIKIEKASISFQLLMQVRNKIVGAYETILRMQV